MGWLLSQGADVDALNHAGSTALHAAASNSHLSAVRCLLLAGGANGHLQDELGETAKDIALRKVRE
jgi:ankyrin repeat protein